MLKPSETLSEAEIRQHIESAGLGSLLRRLFFKRQPELARELGLSLDQVQGLMSGRMDLTEDLSLRLGRILSQGSANQGKQA